MEHLEQCCATIHDHTSNRRADVLERGPSRGTVASAGGHRLGGSPKATRRINRLSIGRKRADRLAYPWARGEMMHSAPLSVHCFRDVDSWLRCPNSVRPSKPPTRDAPRRPVIQSAGWTALHPTALASMAAILLSTWLKPRSRSSERIVTDVVRSRIWE